MAHLLGNRYCIESLRKDVSDIHEAVIDVFSRAGPVRFPSWKFPDKISCDLDLNELLDQYDYSDDEEERQVSHIVLLELVIERMVLLVQAMAKYMEQIFSMGRATSAVHKGSNMSIGLVVKKYWNKMIQLHSMVQQMQSENKTKTRRIVDLENTVEKLTKRMKELEGDSCSRNVISPCQTPGFGGLIPPNNAELGISQPALSSISKDCCHKSSQTKETAFVPCEACARVQINLRDVGAMVTQVVKSQSLPSALAKIKTEMENMDWMSANDIARWTSEQNKDLSKINKHLDHLISTIEPLKSDLSKAQKDCEKFKENLRESNREIQKEKEIQLAQKRQYEKKLQDSAQEKAEVLAAENRKNNELLRVKSKLEAQVGDLRGQLQKQMVTLEELETVQKKLKDDLESNAVRCDRVKDLEDQVTGLTSNLKLVNDKLQSASDELAMEQAKGKSVTKHTQSLQSKQDSLLKRVDELDEENEELKAEVAELELARDDLEENVRKLTKEKRQLDVKTKENEILISELQSGRKALEVSIQELKDTIAALETQAQEAKEREKMMVEYPDLNGPVNPDFVGTGDITLDMENQVKANSMRIQILQEQNEALRNSVSKMLQIQAQKSVNSNAQATNPTGQNFAPKQLWKQDHLASLKEDTQMEVLTEDSESEPYGDSRTHQWTFYRDGPQRVPPLSLNEQESSIQHGGQLRGSHQPRPPSGNTQKRGTTSTAKDKGLVNKVSSQQQSSVSPSKSSIAAYLQLKNSGLLKAGTVEQGRYRPMSGTKSTSSVKHDPNYLAQEVFMCQKCDKIYTNHRDLEIHKTYCQA